MKSEMVSKVLSFFVLLVLILFVSPSFSQKSKKRYARNDKATIDTLNALTARGEWQFPIHTMWDDAIRLSQRSHRPVLAFNVDLDDSSGIHVRDHLLRDPDVMIYLTKNFELALNDFAVDPPPTIGFDSLRNLGARLDGLERGYGIASRPTAIMLNLDSTEIERIPDLQNYGGEQFLKTIKSLLAGKNSVQSLRKVFWANPTNFAKHKKYLDRLLVRFDYDSILLHLAMLSSDLRYGQTSAQAKEAGGDYAYLRFKQEGNIGVLRAWLGSLDRHKDSAIIYAGLSDILEFYRGRKKIDSIVVSYNHLLEFSDHRDPDILNDYAWDLVNFSTRYDSASQIINEAISKNGRNANYFDTKALVDYHRKDYDASISDAKLALKYGSKEDKEYFKDRVVFYENEKKRILIEGSSPSPSKEE